MPPDTLYFRTSLLDVGWDNEVSGGSHGVRKHRKRVRCRWVKNALARVQDADLVYLDPDNSIRSDDASERYCKDGPKHAYMSDLRTFWDAGKSLVVYHQFDKTKSHAAQHAAIVGKIRAALGGACVISLWFRACGTVRVFLVIPQPCRREQFQDRIKAMLDTPWGTEGLFKCK